MSKDNNKRRKLVVISYDAFSEDNWETASQLPHLKKLIQRGAYTNQLQSVYPSLTYVVHTTMMTGEIPGVHGVYHNNPFQPFITEKEQKWFWYREYIKAPVLYDIAKKHHYKTAGILWPVTGKSSITYNLPEVHAIGKENQVLKVLRSGSKRYSLSMELKNGHLRKGIQQPYLDNFSTACAIDTITKKKPELMLLHLTDLDDAKHRFGTQSQEVAEAMNRMDQRIGEIVKSVEEANMAEHTTFMILGDHGQMDVQYQLRLNYVFQEEGLIYQTEEGMQWRAYVQGADGAAYVYVKPGDREAKKRAYKILKEFQKGDQPYGIQEIYDKEQMNQRGVYMPAVYMLEAQKGTYFADSMEGPAVFDLGKAGITHATHGYLPDQENYHCNLVIAGPGIKEDYALGKRSMLDIAPTIAEIMQMKFPVGQGSCMREIFV